MNQHFVPRVYLKNFAEKRGEEYFVDVLNLGTRKIFNTNIKNICAEKDLYTLGETSKFAKNSLTVEKIYSDFLEPVYDEAYKILTDDKRVNITPLERVKIFAGILPFYSRNPKHLIDAIPNHKKELEKLIYEARNKGAKGVTYLEVDFAFRDYSEDLIYSEIERKIINNFKDLHLKLTIKLSEIHENAIIEVLKIDDSETWFFTSDYPLVFDDIVDPADHPFKRTTDFVMPISPKYAIKIYYDNSKKTTQLYKQFTGNLNAASMNEQLSKKARLFLIGSKASFERQKYFEKFLYETSIHAKMDAFRQVYQYEKPTLETSEFLKLMAKYLSIYEQQGTLTPDQEYKFMQSQKELAKKWKKGKV